MSRIGTRQDYHSIVGKEVMWKDDCPFCNTESTKNTLIAEMKYWKIILNKYPYSGQENHLMAVPKRHFVFAYEMSEEENAGIPEIQKYMKDFFTESGEIDYFSATRETMGNRSVEHYHMHFIPGRLQGKFLRCMLENQGFPVKAEIEIKK